MIDNIDLIEKHCTFKEGMYHTLEIVLRKKDFSNWEYSDERQSLGYFFVDTLATLKESMKSIQDTCNSLNARAYLSGPYYEFKKGVNFEKFNNATSVLSEAIKIEDDYSLFDADIGFIYNSHIKQWLQDNNLYLFEIPTVTGYSIIFKKSTLKPNFVPTKIYTDFVQDNPQLLLFYNNDINRESTSKD